MLDEQSGGFQVNNSVEVPDLSTVVEKRSLIPACKDVRFMIASGSILESQDKSIKGLNLTLQIMDGIQVKTKDGDTVVDYVGRKIQTGLMTLVIWADKSLPKRQNSDWWKTDQQYVGFKQFLMAMNIPLKGTVVNDDFIADLIGKEVIASITHEEETIKNDEGKSIKTGVFREKLKFWKKA